MRLLFPDQAPRLLSLEVNNIDNKSCGATADLNEKQSAFCQMVLARTQSPATDQVRGPMVLTGPAGTGKTKTLLASIQLVLNTNSNLNKTGTTDSSKQQYRILVCTPSHTACDVVCRRLSQFLDKTQLFRLFDADRPIATVPIEILILSRRRNLFDATSVRIAILSSDCLYMQ
jgi:Cdc6-like AAA superfamily ATPase